MTWPLRSTGICVFVQSEKSIRIGWRKPAKRTGVIRCVLGASLQSVVECSLSTPCITDNRHQEKPCITVNRPQEKPCITVNRHQEKPCITVNRHQEKPCVTVNRHKEKPCVIVNRHQEKPCVIINRRKTHFQN